MIKKRTDPMVYQPEMEKIDSDIRDKVLKNVDKYDDQKITDSDVEEALKKERLSISDYGALLSPAATPYLEEMAKKAMIETNKHFGNSIGLFTPLYIANYCENNCVYCGFNCKNKIRRGKLSLAEMETELKAIAKTGLKEILILTGESRHHSGVEYIGEGVKLAAEYFATVGIEIYPLNTNEYAYLHNCGADFVSVYQETYDLSRYEQVHLSGPKRVFPYRFEAQERALLGGMRGVSFGALLGLGNFRKDAFATGLHAYFILQKYPHAEISFSTPRLRPFINKADNNPNDVHEKQLLQVMLAYRLLMPFAGITISTRERPGFRDHVIGMVATKISAGVSVGVGGHEQEEKGDEQFEISDPRSVPEVHQMILNRGLQPVYCDYIRV
ncbi:2-iminoacetate synthase ThiH [Acetobacterium wieringae]|uniref:2-iminoacetate synthase n=1 Tax=Acetobacterium wieringae TaxID=52694 RepID=A0A1F2PJG1_9FIRM|nr:2-iminoacetate synthase ThiH [Acetobacterium wieringae]OFV71175.1 2-iminoacetate synthase [Acetobacterium wieringae]URN84472.1 2-iminoacetate synthase ThiH [Acetobacterium wieringae]UYO62914.1 2-iminoacetate synthase ThiH [Acetobacterium wieringae]VUZ26720.1 2-iminoacetate synthase [Acetobacterium wieringae]